MPARRVSKEKERATAPAVSYDSMKGAAAGMGVPLYVIKRAKVEVPAAFRGSRVYATEELKLWLQSQDFEAGDQDKSVWEARCAKQRFEREEWEFARDRGEFKAKKVFAAELMGLASEQKALIRQKLENEYPGLCPGLEPAQRAALKKCGRGLSDELSRRMQRLVDRWRE